MQNLIKYISLLFEKKYNVELQGEPICVKEIEGLPCYCISGEFLSQAINTFLLWGNMDNYSIDFRIKDDVFYPVVMTYIDGKKRQYIKVYSNDPSEFRATMIGRNQCGEKKDDKYYIKYVSSKMTSEEYRSELIKQEDAFFQNYVAQDRAKLKYRFALKMLLKIRFSDDKELHFAFLAMLMYLEPNRMHVLLKSLLEKEELKDSDIKIVFVFIEEYISFLDELTDLSEQNKSKQVQLEQFSYLFRGKWNMDIATIISDYFQDLKMDKQKEFVCMMQEALNNSIKEAFIKMVREELKIIQEKRIGDIELAEVEKKIENLICKRDKQKNRTLS